MPKRLPEQRCDVVIVGAGASGCLIAAELAEGGQDVLVLEAGPPWRPSDLWSSQLWARRLKWRGPEVSVGGTNPISHNLIMGSGLGGAALHHYATWPRFDESVFQLHKRYGRGRDWPFEYQELRPYYDRVQRRVGLSGNAEAETWRPPGDPYPMPPLQSFRHGEILRSGFSKLGLAVAPLPAAINSHPYEGRAACLYDGWCDAGCPIGALGNPLVTDYPRARTAGARFRTGCQVTRVLTDPRGRAVGVEFIEGQRRVHVEAARIVLATSVVENVRILLNSAGPRHARGLGNDSGLLGRYVMAEIMVLSYGLFEGPVDNHRGVNAGQFMHRAAVSLDSLPGLIGGYQWQIAPSLKPNDIFGIACSRTDLYGSHLDNFLRSATRDLAFMVGFGGGIPAYDNAITLDERVDRFGMRQARVVHRFTEEQIRLAHFMLDQGRDVMYASGARESWSVQQGAGHLIGGTLIGREAGDSVADSWGALHELPNVYVTGAGLFPASGGASPTFTVEALALRTAEHLKA